LNVGVLYTAGVMLVHFIFLSHGGAPKRRGAWNNIPPYAPPSRGFASVKRFSGPDR